MKAGRHRRLLAPAAVVLALGLALSSCSSTATSADGVTITANTGASGAFVRNFNPFLPNQAQAGYGGTVYESLLFFDMAERRPPVPQLATAATFSPTAGRSPSPPATA